MSRGGITLTVAGNENFRIFGIVFNKLQIIIFMEIYKYLNLEMMDCAVAIIKNAKSNCMGKKDMIY